MYHLGENRFLVETKEDLKALPLFGILTADFETGSGDPKADSKNPWHTCYPLGFAYTGDNDCRSFYVPWFLPGDEYTLPSGGEFFFKLVENCLVWNNHNIKYDAHVVESAAQEIEIPINSSGNAYTPSLPEHVELHCTLTAAHLIDADRTFKGGYSLDALAKAWLPKCYRKEGANLKPYLKDTKDYTDIPTPVLAKYACTDVIVTRALFWYCAENIPAESALVYENETHLTKVLWRIERNGLRVDVTETKIAEIHCLRKMIDIEKKLEALIGYPMNPGSSAQVKDLVCTRYGLKPVAWNKGKNGKPPTPCFDKKALAKYINDPYTPKELREALKLVQSYRVESQHRGLFYEPWQTLHVKGILHGSYNQNVRSSRMSCSEPNETQINKTAKSLIKPKPGNIFLNFDYDQIEYRILIHYIQDKSALAKYAENPDIDFHQFKADSAGISRRGAKTVNFSMSFGQGRPAAVALLVLMLMDEDKTLTIKAATVRANEIYDAHMDSMPTLQPTKRKATKLAEQRGYIKSLGGRRLHLPGPRYNLMRDDKGQLINRCHIALTGRCVQGTAAEIMKFRAVGIQGLLKNLDCELVALVHDSFVIETQDDTDDVIFYKAQQIRNALEVNPFKMSVPIRASCGISRLNWADCESDGRLIEQRHISGPRKVWCGAVSRKQLDDAEQIAYQKIAVPF